MGDGGGFGQQDPTDSAGEFNTLTFIILQQLAKLSTIEIVLVKAVDTDAKTVDVQPMVNQLDGNSQSSPHGIILGIPYMIWQYGPNAVLADPVVGDIGVMACSDRDTSSVRATKAIANPGSDRQFDKADGIYFGGILNGDPTQWVKFTDTGMEMSDKNGNTLVSSVAGWTFTGNVIMNQNLLLAGNVLGSNGGIYPGSIHVGGTLTGDTDVIAGGVSGKTHHHVQSGGGNTGPPV